MKSVTWCPSASPHGLVCPRSPGGAAAVPERLGLPSQRPARSPSRSTRAFCKGPAGSVYEVALSQTTEYYAAITRFRVSDGRADPGPTRPRPAPASSRGRRRARRQPLRRVETQTGTRDWAVLKFDRTGSVEAVYDSGKGSDALRHDRRPSRRVIVAGTSDTGATTSRSSSGTLRQRKWKRIIAAVSIWSPSCSDANDNVYAAAAPERGIGRRSCAPGLPPAVSAGWRRRPTRWACRPGGTSPSRARRCTSPAATGARRPPGSWP